MHWAIQKSSVTAALSIYNETRLLLVPLLLDLIKFQKGFGFSFSFRSEASLLMYAHRAVLQILFTELFSRRSSTLFVHFSWGYVMLISVLRGAKQLFMVTTARVIWLRACVLPRK